MTIYANILLLWNIAVFLIYGTDKFLAIRSKQRIRESVLLLSAFLLGSVGAVCGMLLFNHKTAKPKFKILVPVALVFDVILIVFMINRFNIGF